MSAPGEKVFEKQGIGKKVSVERTNLRHAPFKINYSRRPSVSTKYVTLAPSYEQTEEEAIETAKGWVDGGNA